MTDAARQLFERPTKSEWNPRFIAYARSHRSTPEAQLDADAVQWPGGTMTGYTLWIAWAWRTWDAIHMFGPNHVRTDAEQDNFTLWLLDATQGL